MAVSFAQVDALLKTRYTKKKLWDLTLKYHPTLAMMPKNTKGSGRSMVVPVIGGSPQGVGSQFKAAQNNKSTGGNQKAFNIFRGRGYGIFSLDGETMEATEGQEGAFMDGVTRLTDGVIQAMGNDTSRKLFRDGTGVMGVVDASTNLASTSLKLTNASDAKGFAVDEIICLVDPAGKVYRNPTSAGGYSTGAQLTITNIDEDGGILTVNQNISTGIAAAATGDLIVRDGDYQALPVGATQAGTTLSPTGFDGWLPQTAPTVGGGDSFWGVDRSAYAARYAGRRYTANGSPMKKAITKMASIINDAGFAPDYVVMDYSNLELLETEVESKRVYVKPPDSPDPEFGFDGVVVATGRGPITCLGDNSCQPDRGYMLTMESWEFETIGEFPKLLRGDGRDNVREATLDAYEWRYGFYGQFKCFAPGANGVITF